MNKKSIFIVPLNIFLFSNWRKSNAHRFFKFLGFKWYEACRPKKLGGQILYTCKKRVSFFLQKFLHSKFSRIYYQYWPFFTNIRVFYLWFFKKMCSFDQNFEENFHQNCNYWRENGVIFRYRLKISNIFYLEISPKTLILLTRFFLFIYDVNYFCWLLSEKCVKKSNLTTKKSNEKKLEKMY